MRVPHLAFPENTPIPIEAMIGALFAHLTMLYVAECNTPESDPEHAELVELGMNDTMILRDLYMIAKVNDLNFVHVAKHGAPAALRSLFNHDMPNIEKIVNDLVDGFVDQARKQMH